jgi:hypothetical protein
MLCEHRLAMVTARLHSSLGFALTLALLSSLGCAKDTLDEAGDEVGDTGGTTGDGDGDPTTTGDGDGDGDGDPTTTGDGDGDPTTTGDGDGDGDPTTTGDGDGEPADIPNMDGVYLFALETSLGPDLPLQFVTTISNMSITGSGATADFSFQPLSLDQGETLTPRMFIGDPLDYPGVVFDVDGGFALDMGLVMVTGQANPITGSDIEADLQVIGDIVQDNALCGELTGMLQQPLMFDLAGSTFAAIALADDGSDPATLPVSFPYRCDMVPPP